MFDTIQCGDRVTIKTRHGIPGMATERNVIKVQKAKRDKFALQAAIINGGFGQ